MGIRWDVVSGTGFESTFDPILESLRQERQFREEGDEHLHKRLEAAEPGGLHISLIGVIWIFLGLILSTVSPEIAQWMR